MLTFNCRPKESETLDMSLLPEVDNDDNDKLGTVSYTHLDVYKRQIYTWMI